MGMTLNDFEAKALQILLSQRFLSLPLFEEEELSEYHIADNQGEMNLEDFIRQYAEVIMEQFKADYEARLKADMAAMLAKFVSICEQELSWVMYDTYGNETDVHKQFIDIFDRVVQEKNNALRGKGDKYYSEPGSAKKAKPFTESRMDPEKYRKSVVSDLTMAKSFIANTLSMLRQDLLDRLEEEKSPYHISDVGVGLEIAIKIIEEYEEKLK